MFSPQNLPKLFDQFPGFLLITSGLEHRIEFANKGFAQLVDHRHTGQELLRDAFPELIPQGIIELRDRVFRTGEPYRGRRSFTLHAEQAEPEERFIDYVYQPLVDEDGRVTGIIFAGYDITDQTRSAERLQTLQMKLIEVARGAAMGDLAKTIAHEVNQPLAAITSYATGLERLLVRDGGVDTDRVVATVREIRRTAFRAADVIKRVRQMAKGASSHCAIYDLADIIEEVAPLAFLDSAAKGVSSKLSLERDLLVEVDQIQIQQVILNMVRNSIEAVTSSATKEVLISCRRVNDSAETCIEDTGVGLADQVKESLFQPVLSEKEDGMGVGLSICRTIVEAHQGKISAESREAGGAKFCMTLPLTRTANQPGRA